MAKIYERTLVELKSPSEMKEVIRSATVGFVGCFMLEIIHEYEKFRDKESKSKMVKRFCSEYSAWARDEYEMRNRINVVIRIIESEMVIQALEYVLSANNRKLDIPEIKENANNTLGYIESGKLELPRFVDREF